MGVDLAVDVSSRSHRATRSARSACARASTSGLRCRGHAGALPDMIDEHEPRRRGSPCSACPPSRIAIDWGKVVTHMLTLKGIYGREMFETWNSMSAMLQHGPDLRSRVTSIITDRFPRTRMGAAFDAAAPAASARSSSTGHVRSRHVRKRSAIELQADARRDPGRRPVQARARHRVPQAAHDRGRTGDEVLNFCANNYLGLADDPRIVAAAKAALDEWGFGMASVRFICGTQDPAHGARAPAVASSSAPRTRSCSRSCFDANGGVFEVLLGAEDAVISDELNHASIIDGIRLSQGAAGCATATATWPTSRPSSRQSARARGAGDRHRRRVLDGRLPRARWTRSATWPNATTRW